MAAACIICGGPVTPGKRGRPRTICGVECERKRAVQRARAHREARWHDREYQAMHKASARRWAERNPDEKQRASRRSYLWSVYRLTPEAYDALLAAQGGGCAICGSTVADLSARSLHVDHDHRCCPGERSCGECVRGLLCRPCNLGIAHFKDDPGALTRAADYLSASTAATRKAL